MRWSSSRHGRLDRSSSGRSRCHTAFTRRLVLRAVSLPPLLAGARGRDLRAAARERPFRARRCSSAGRSPRSGWSGLPSTLLPSHDRTLLIDARARTRCIPSRRRSSRPLGLALARRRPRSCAAKRRAWQVALGAARRLDAAASVPRVQSRRRGDRARRASRCVAQRHEFDAPGDPATRPALALRAVLLARRRSTPTARARSGSTGSRSTSRLTSASLSRETARRSSALASAARRTSAGEFGDWFPLSVLVLGLAGATWLLLGLARALAIPTARRRRASGALARDLVAPGASTRSRRSCSAPTSRTSSPTDERAFLAYRVVGGVAIVSGDPIGAAAARSAAARAFIALRPRAGLALRDPRRLGALPRALPAPRPARALPR